jgi:hypothetical protein
LDHNKFSTKTIADFVGEERKISFYKLKTNKETFNFEVKDIDVRNFYDNNSEKYRSKAIKKFTVLNLNPSTVLNELNIKEDQTPPQQLDRQLIPTLHTTIQGMSMMHTRKQKDALRSIIELKFQR